MNKLHMFLILSGLMAMAVSANAAESITAEKVYMYAKTKNTTALKLLNEKIDAVDSNGNTALCLSIMKQDKNAYDMLKEAGVNPYADCVNKIGMASGDEAATSSATAASTSASSGTFLGMGTVGWSVTGAIVAGGAVAAAAGGGGGGGGSSSGSSSSGDSDDNDCSNIKCGKNAQCNAGKCECKFGYEGDPSYGCSTPVNCVHGYKDGYKCICDEGWTGDICATIKDCTGYNMYCETGYHATSDTCLSGPMTMYKCEADTCDGYNYTTCPTGYVQSDSCQAGGTIKLKCDACADGYQKENGECVKITICQNGGIPNGASCSCPDGWEGQYCQTAKTCSGYEESCAQGYHTTTDTCQSGNTTMYKCEINECVGYASVCGDGYHTTSDTCYSGWRLKYRCEENTCDGFNYTECPAGYSQSEICISGETTKMKCDNCAYGYEKNSSGECVKITECQNGGTWSGEFCSCTEGWMGDMCEQPANCEEDFVEKCADGYHETTSCKSGNTVLHKCEANVCTTGSTSDSCPEGHHAELTGEYSGNQQCFVCVEDGVALDCGTHGTAKGDVCQCDSGYAGTFCNLPDENHIIGTDGNLYEKLSCQNSGTQVNASCSCPDGWEGQYCQTAKTCSGYEESCAQGYHTTTDTCQSGNNTMYKCETDSCDGYNYTTCPIGYAQSDSCQAGETIKLKCDNCADGYEKDTTGICKIKKATLDDVVGKHLTDDITANNEDIIITNSNDADVYGVKNEGKSSSFVSNIYVDWLASNIHNLVNIPESLNIKITNQGNGDVYGLFNGNFNIYIDSRESGTNERKGIIMIDNKGHGNVYGMIGNEVINAHAAITTEHNTKAYSKATGGIAIRNEGDGNVYGLYAKDGIAVNANNGHSKDAEVEGYINIVNNGNGNTYGIYSNKEAYNVWHKPYREDTAILGYLDHDRAHSNIIIINNGNGNSYGMYCKTCVNDTDASYRPLFLINTSSGRSIGLYSKNGEIDNSGRITIHNLGSGTAIGIYADESTKVTKGGSVTINRDLFYNNFYNPFYKEEYVEGNREPFSYFAESDVGGSAIGLYSEKGAKIFRTGSITINNAEYAVGVYAKTGSSVERASSITINNSLNAIGVYADANSSVEEASGIFIKGSTNAIGIYASSGAKVNSICNINIDGATIAYGIYAESGAAVTLVDRGTGGIDISGDNIPEKVYGIYAETGATVTNNGFITIYGDQHHENAIKLNGSPLFQDGALIVTNNSQNSPMSVSSVKPASLNLNDFGGTVVASDTSQFVVEGAISGDLAINNSVIENGFDTTYSVKNMIQAEDTSGLNLQSQSALFDATLQNNTDAVMTMKAFNDVVDNSSVADFLQANYAEGNNEKLFSTLKSAASVAQLNNNIDDLFGKNMLSRMAFEDLSMLREVSLDMNNHLFKQEGAFAFGGNVSPSSYDNNIGSIGRYSLNGYNNGKMSFGVGVSITDVRTDDGHSDNRRFDRNFMMSAPIGYKTHGFELITAPKMGYADGNYDRDGFNNMTYEGKVQKRMFALMNEARYPVKFGGLRLVPSAEFNMIGYNIKGHEDDKEYSLRIKSQNHYSVEAGLGLMAEKEFKPFKNHKFNVNGGVAVYHEFANPYELDVAMNGMSGTYRLQDEKRSDNRAVVRFGFGYELKDNVDVSASWLTNIDREYRTDASIDMKYHF